MRCAVDLTRLWANRVYSISRSASPLFLSSIPRTSPPQEPLNCYPSPKAVAEAFQKSNFVIAMPSPGSSQNLNSFRRSYPPRRRPDLPFQAVAGGARSAGEHQDDGVGWMHQAVDDSDCTDAEQTRLRLFRSARDDVHIRPWTRLFVSSPRSLHYLRKAQSPSDNQTQMFSTSATVPSNRADLQRTQVSTGVHKIFLLLHVVPVDSSGLAKKG